MFYVQLRAETSLLERESKEQEEKIERLFTEVFTGDDLGMFVYKSVGK